LLKIKFEKDKLFATCQKGKSKIIISFKKCDFTSKPLELLQMDLFSPSRIKKFWGKLL